MSITRSDVEKIAELARLDLTPQEVDQFTGQLASILSHIEKLNELDTTGVEPMSHSVTNPGNVESALRMDSVLPCIGQKVATENAPDAEAGFFRVPRVIGG
jgi:aspartyl-tRNA(Asn)/glutamyl-tRNA(Gln) amidotransferase subunit C